MNVKSQLIQGINEFDSLFFEFLDRLKYPFRKSRIRGFTKNTNNENENNENNWFNTTKKKKSSFTLNPFRKGTLKRIADSNAEETTRKSCIQTIWNKLGDIIESRYQLGHFYPDFRNNSILNYDKKLNYYNRISINIKYNDSKSPYLYFLDQYAEFVNLLELVQTISSCKSLQRVQQFVKKINTKKLWPRLFSLLDMYEYSFFPENTKYIPKEPIVSNTKNKSPNNNAYSVSSTELSNNAYSVSSTEVNNGYENNNAYSISSTEVNNGYDNNNNNIKSVNKYAKIYNANNYTGVNNNTNSVVTQSSDPKSIRSHRTTRKNMRR